MDAKLSDLKKIILRALDDEVDEDLSPLGGSNYSADLLKDGISAALKAITIRSWKRNVEDIEAEAENFDLPTDYLGIDAVYSEDLGIFIPEVSFIVGNALAAPSGNGWYHYPTGTITFINAFGSKGGKVYYRANWPVPASDQATCEAPEVTKTALVLFAASYCLYPTANSTADVRQFNTKVDSGQPGDIPAKQMSDFFLKRFEIELQRIPMMTQGRTQ